MLAFVVVLQVIVALFLILVVLLQPGNRGGASAALGGAGSDTVFGGRGANTFLSKITFGAATLFMITNFALSFMTSSELSRSATDVLPASTKKEPAPDAAANPDAAKDTQAVDGEKAPEQVDAKPSDSEAAPKDAEEKPQGEAAKDNQ